ncbi:MAG: hypothetical protein K6G78_03595 [bacterium]|nr:hypothetical protein [bacterium]
MPRRTRNETRNADAAGRKLLSYALKRGAIFLAVYVLVLFPLAGTIRYWQGWALIAIIAIPASIVGLVLLKVERDVLADLVVAREQGLGTASVPTVSYVMAIAVIFASGLSYRGSFLMISGFVSFFGLFFAVISFGLLFEAVREDSIRSEIFDTISMGSMEGTGLYGRVRHPIHFAVHMMLLSIGLVLGSIVACGIALIYPLVVAPGIISKERQLEREDAWFRYYKTKVKYRMIPKVW